MLRIMVGLIICALIGSVPVLAQEMEPGYVLQAAGRLVFIDKGEQDDVRPGDLVQVVRQETIIHPVTGENLGAQVALGVVRIVEVFPKLSTAEVVDLLRGVTMASLDMEARQGLIRTRSLSPEQEVMIQEKMVAKQSGLMAPPGRMNPDGIIGLLTPEVHVGFGNRVGLSVPDKTYKLIDPTLTFSNKAGAFVNGISDSAFAGIANTGLLSMADTTSSPQDLGPFGSSVLTSMALTYPLSERMTGLANIDLGVRSRVAVGARVYAGRLFRFLGSGYTPDGRVGAVVISVRVGWGGQGARSLPVDALTRLTARTDLQADSTFLAALDTLQLAQGDSLLQAGVTEVLRDVATDSMQEIAGRSLGVSVELKLPLSRHFVLQGNLIRYGNVDEIGGQFTYYLRSVERDSPRANPDGTIRSLVLWAGGRYDSGLSRSSLDLGITFPIVQRFTLSTAFQTDFEGYNRFGFSLKSYL